MSGWEWFLHFLCDELKRWGSPAQLKKELSLRQIQRWQVYFQKKYGREGETQTENEVVAGLLSNMTKRK